MNIYVKIALFLRAMSQADASVSIWRMPRGSNNTASSGRIALCCAVSLIPCQLAAGTLIPADIFRMERDRNNGHTV